ncbi:MULTISPECIES: hypothetical protein [unclassified Clostridium]|uniref:hypothetical protein n=1 Tax=unclassified Clostridium TaxID=2614128 RepID=UPI000297820C|nr:MULTISPECIES: hypothetical protein [unclassified Clostridium]EKQ54569.1 MAG: hypothetical protein A370_03119 [Clostridium sp. Maddingley MBC34-26]
MQSALLKLITDANERIYLKTLLLDNTIVKLIINKKNVDIKVSIKRDWVNLNCEFIEELFRNDIIILTHDDNESFVIIDKYQYRIDYIEQNIRKDILEKSIKKNFRNNSLCISEEDINAYKVNKLINEIKDEFRLVSFSMSGIKIYLKKINFASLLKKNSQHKIIADEEKFELYDKNFLNNKLKEEISEDEFIKLKAEYDKLIKICDKFNRFGEITKRKYLCGKIYKFILVNQEDVYKITREINQINNLNKNINDKYFDFLMDKFYGNFVSKLNEILKRHYIHDNKDVENFKKEVRNTIPKAKIIKEKIKINNYMILELSREMLLNQEVIQQLKSFQISDNIKDKLNKLENLLKAKLV